MKLRSFVRFRLSAILLFLLLGLIDKCVAECEEVGVLILGGGFAGLGAAYELYKSNEANTGTNKIISFKVLEADNRVGGRGIAVHWWAGGEGNPLYDLMWELFGNSVPTTNTRWDSLVYYKADTTWRRRPETYGNNEIPWREWSDAYTCMDEKSLDYYFDHITPPNDSSNVDDIGLRGALDQCNWVCNSNEKAALEWYDIDYEYTVYPQEISLMGVIWPYSDFQDKSAFILDTRNGAVVAEELYYRYLSGNVELNKTVTHVAYTADWDGDVPEPDPEYPVTVTAEDVMTGVTSEYCAKRFIFTGSVGVLDNEVISWSPTYPEAKLTAMRNTFQMGHYHELAIKFKTKFWLNDVEFLVTPFVDRGHCSHWQNYDELYPDSHVLVCALTTEAFEALGGYGGIDEEKVEDLLQETLGEVYEEVNDYNCVGTNPPYLMDVSAPPDPVSAPDCQYRIFQDENELWYGSYAYWKTGGTAANFKKFIAPLPDQDGTPHIHFAGSATCFRHWEYAHGAWYSGIREATNSITSILKGEVGNYIPTDQFCEAAPDGGIGNPTMKSGAKQSGGNRPHSFGADNGPSGARTRTPHIRARRW